nr:hypothetical protein [Tanacetum cinerariifolium]
MNYKPITAGTQSNGFAVTKASDNAGQARKETEPIKDYIVLPLLTANPPFSQDLKSSNDDGSKPSSDDRKKVDEDPRKENECKDQKKEDNVNSTNNVNTVSSTFNAAGTNKDNKLPFDPNMPALKDDSIFNFSSDDEDDGKMADMNNLETTIQIEEEVYVCQPLGFEDLDFPDRVYKMGCMEELTFFLRLQVKQKRDGTFISQDKYVAKILKKFRFTKVKTTSTLMETKKPLPKDEDGEEVDVHMYRSMIGSLVYLTSSRPDIMFTVCACARYQVNPKVSHLHAMKRIFKYLKGQSELGLWYPKDSPFDLVSYTDSDYVGASLDRKSTTGEVEYVAALTYCGRVLWIQNQLLDYGKPKRKYTQVPQPSGPTESVAGEAVHKELSNSLVRAVTTASSLKAEQDSGNTIQSDEDSLKLNELIELCTNLKNRVLDLEKTKTTQKNEIDSLKRKGRIDDIDADEDITLVNDVDNELFDVDDLGGEEVFVTKQEVVSTVATTETITTEEITLAQALEALKTWKPKAKGVAFQKPCKSTTITTPIISSQQSRDKGKEIMIEEPVKPKKKDQIRIDKEAGLKLKAEFDEEERLAKILQAQEQEKLSDAENATLFQQLLKKRRKYFAAKRAEEKRKKPPTQAQKRKIMCTYLKNMKGYKIKDLKLKEFDKIQKMEDLEDLYKLVKVRYGSTRPVESMDYLLWSDLKIMFEPHVEDESMQIYMLVEKKYPLTPPTLSTMLEKKLQTDYESKMAYQLCKLIKK